MMNDREEALRLYAFVSGRCEACDGRGYYSVPAHDPNCDGSCVNCPVEDRAQCDCDAEKVETLAAALASARREGAEEMQERCVRVAYRDAEETAIREGTGYSFTVETDAALRIAAAIRALVEE